MCYQITILVIALGAFDSVAAQDSLRFGPVRLGTVQRDTLTFANPHLVDLMIERVALDSDAFEVLGAPFSGALSAMFPGESRAVPIAFRPAQKAEIQSRLEIQTHLGDFAWIVDGEGVDEVVVINEILADPPSGLAGDANGDGVRSSGEDEFVELLNTGKYPIDISGWQLSDRNADIDKRFSFPEGTWIEPGAYRVLFGGGSPVQMGNFTDDGKIGGGLSNSGDEVFLFDPSGRDTLARASFGRDGGKDQSVVRAVEGRGEWVLHTQFPGSGDRFSPGRARDVYSALRIEPDDTVVAVGDTLRFRAAAHSVRGETLDVSDQVTWQAAGDGALEDLGGGVWAGRLAGRITLLAEMPPLEAAQATVLVEGESLAELRTVPADTTLLVGEAFGVQGFGVFADGDEIGLDDLVLDVQGDGVIDLRDGRILGMRAGQSSVLVRHSELTASLAVLVADFGDLNADGTVALTDAIRTVHIVAQMPPPPTDFERRSADLDANGLVDVRDVIRIVNIYLDREAPAKPAVHAVGVWRKEGSHLVFEVGESLRMIWLQTSNARTIEFDTAGVMMISSGDRTTRDILLLDETGEGIPASRAHHLAFDSGDFEVQHVAGLSVSGVAVTFQSDHGVARSGLSRVYPNPFNPSVALEYELKRPQPVSLVIFNPQGQELIRLIDADHLAGTFSVVWDGLDRFGLPVGSGVYLACFRGRHFSSTRKLVLTK